MRPLESLEARALPGTAEAGRPFWSPDSKSLAFVAGGKLKRIEVAGGSPITLCDARFARGGTWNEDGVIVFGDQAAGTATDSCVGRDSVAGDASEQRSRGDVSLLPAVSARRQAVSLPCPPR